MADLIERDAVIWITAETGALETQRRVKELPSVNRWIPVEDALPENKEIVWLCLYLGKDAYVRKGYIRNELWFTADGYLMCIIPKFWMHEYIPEPPEKIGDDDHA